MRLMRNLSWKLWSALVLLGWWGNEVIAGEPLLRLPPLVTAPKPWPDSARSGLSEPLQSFMLSPAWETRLASPKLRSAVSVRVLAERVVPMWAQTEPRPERPHLPAGPKSYAASSESLAGLPLRWLREQPQDETLSAGVVEGIWGEYVRRRVEYWRIQPVAVEPAQIPDVEANQRQARWQERVQEFPLPFVPSSRPPTPLLPSRASGN